MVFSVLAVSGLVKDCLFPPDKGGLALDDLRNELFLVEGSVGS